MNMVKITYIDDKLLINNQYYDFTSNFIFMEKDKIYRHGFRKLIERSENGEIEISLNLPAPGIIYRIFTNYFYPAYYTPTFDYKNVESRYYLGVHSGKTSLQGEPLSYSTYFIFIYDIILQKPVWIWDLKEYSEKINFPVPEVLFEQGIENCFRLGKNDLGFDEDTIVALISRINHVLFINPKTNEIIKTIKSNENVTHFVGFNIIPKGLPGENNFLFYNMNTKKDSPSEIIEYDSKKQEVIFRFGCEDTDAKNPEGRFFGSVQKLPNGNYLLYNYTKGLILEISSDKEIVDKISISPFPGENVSLQHRSNRCSKALAVPKEWVKKITHFLNKSN